MASAETGKRLPKKGKVLHPAAGSAGTESSYAAAIATALRHDLGVTRHAVKTAMQWTGASERTVKYWFAGTSGPGGEHLIALARHSDAVFDVVLLRARGRGVIATRRVAGACQDLLSALNEFQAAVGHDGG